MVEIIENWRTRQICQKPVWNSAESVQQLNEPNRSVQADLKPRSSLSSSRVSPPLHFLSLRTRKPPKPRNPNPQIPSSPSPFFLNPPHLSLPYLFSLLQNQPTESPKPEDSKPTETHLIHPRFTQQMPWCILRWLSSSSSSTLPQSDGQDSKVWVYMEEDAIGGILLESR